MSIEAINLGSSPTGAGGDNLREALEKVNASFAGVDGNHVAGGAGFVNVSGAITLDLATARVFHHTLTGNATGPSFTNLPDEDVYSPSWRWVLKIDATGGYVLSSPPTVTWVDGGSLDDLNMTANAVNTVLFWRDGATTFGRIVSNGLAELDELMLDFPAAGTIKLVVRTPVTIDVASAEIDGAGTVVYEKNGSVITVSTAFTTGDTLEVTAAAGQSITIPRYAS